MLAQELQRHGSLLAIPDVIWPAEELFGTALEIGPEDDLRIQAAFQEHADNTALKAINCHRQRRASSAPQLCYNSGAHDVQIAVIHGLYEPVTFKLRGTRIPFFPRKATAHPCPSVDLNMPLLASRDAEQSG